MFFSIQVFFILIYFKLGPLLCTPLRWRIERRSTIGRPRWSPRSTWILMVRPILLQVYIVAVPKWRNMWERWSGKEQQKWPRYPVGLRNPHLCSTDIPQKSPKGFRDQQKHSQSWNQWRCQWQSRRILTTVQRFYSQTYPEVRFQWPQEWLL